MRGSFVVTFLIFAVLFSQVADGKDMKHVKKKIRDEKKCEVADLPSLPEASKRPQYHSFLVLTIDAFKTHSFIDLFRESRLAKDVASDWLVNTGLNCNSINLDPLKQALVDVACEIIGNEAHSELVFANLVDARLQGYCPEPLNGKIDTLMALGFQFPLFTRVVSDTDYHDKMHLLIKFVSKHRQKHNGLGGLGNLNWEQLYYLPVDGEFFSENKVDWVLRKAEVGVSIAGGIIPLPMLPDIAVHLKDGMVVQDFEMYPLDNDHCCCNISGHGPGNFRNCAGEDDKICNMCGSYCCLAGVMWCTQETHQH